jgi:hypothetical protein
MILAAEQRRETGAGIEARKTEPINGPVARYQSGGMAVADQCIIFNR